MNLFNMYLFNRKMYSILRLLLALVMAFSLLSFKEKGDTVDIRIINKIEQLELQSKISQSQIENMDKANDKILQVTYFTVGAMFALISGLAIWNGLVNYRINTDKVRNAIDEIRNEQQVSISKYLESAVNNKIKSEISDVKRKFEILELSILSLQIELKKMQVVSSDLSPGANLETYTLVELLDLEYKKFKTGFASSDYGVIHSLEAIITYTKKYTSLSNSEVDKILVAVKKIEGSSFTRYIDEITKNLIGTR